MHRRDRIGQLVLAAVHQLEVGPGIGDPQHQPARRLPQLLGRRQAGLGIELVEDARRLLCDAAYELLQQRFLALEIVVDRGAPEPDEVGDVLQARRSIAALGKKARGLVEDLAGQDFATWAAARARLGHAAHAPISRNQLRIVSPAISRPGRSPALSAMP